MLDRRDLRGIGIYPRRASRKELARKHAIIGGVAIWTGRQGPA